MEKISWKFLVIEDDHIFLEETATGLKRLFKGSKVEKAPTINKAKAHFDERFDFVVLDLCLAERPRHTGFQLGGTPLVEELRERWPTTHIIIYTISSEDDVKEVITFDEYIHYVGKYGLEEDDLITVIDSIIKAQKPVADGRGTLS